MIDENEKTSDGSEPKINKGKAVLNTMIMIGNLVGIDIVAGIQDKCVYCSGTGTKWHERSLDYLECWYCHGSGEFTPAP